jgi:maltose alpha-D-glucosyltransferase/alpha-amylase
MNDLLFTTSGGLQRLAATLLPPWMAERRWFAGKARTMRVFRIVRHVVIGPAHLLAVEVSYAEGDSETYAVPLAIAADAEPQAVVAQLENGVLFDATHDAEFRAALFRLIQHGGRDGELSSEAGGALAAMFSDGVAPESRVLDAEQSNTSLIYGERLFVKLYRKLSAGINPDAEITRFLSERAKFRHVAAFGGAIEWAGASLALATAVVPNHGNAWSLALREFSHCIQDPDAIADWTTRVYLLGLRTGEMHLALASDASLPEFTPERIEESDTSRVVEGVTQLAARVSVLLGERLDSLEGETRLLAEKVLQNGVRAKPVTSAFSGMKTRTHGDYHLGQVLDTGDDFLIIDFEGEPSRTLDQRRAKHPPLRDVAGMLRSFHYAAHAGRKSDASVTAGQTEHWARRSQQVFLTAWRAAISESLIETPNDAELLRLFLLEKALYEVLYEFNNRPDWLDIPLRGLLALG